MLWRLSDESEKRVTEFDVQTLEMILVFGLIAVALYLYASERLAMEVTSLAVICVLMILFHFLPIVGDDGTPLLNAKTLLAGFANPAMMTVLSLLILGEGLSRTGALDEAASLVQSASKGNAHAAIGLALLMVCLVSAVLNNIPVVVLFIPIMQALAVRANRSAARYMMPLSFAAILGGMTTLIGSSTNLLVSSAMIELGEQGLSFFSFTIPGLVVAGAGMIYVVFILPNLLPDREGETDAVKREAKQFTAQLVVQKGSRLDGMASDTGFFPELAPITILSIERGKESLRPPFDDMALTPGDILIIAATRDELVKLHKEDPTALAPELMMDSAMARLIDAGAPWTSGAQSVAEVMVTPTSRMAGRTLSQIGFRYRYDCIVIGVERRKRMARTRHTDIPLEPGDILLIQGQRSDILALRGSQEVVLMEWSAEDLPQAHHAKRAVTIFAGTIGAAATGLVPTEVATLTGAAAMVIVGALRAEDAIRAIDHKIILLIAAALALGAAMQVTGGAAFLSLILLWLLDGASPAIVLSGFFLLTAILANILSTKATAVLFTPIAVAIARDLNVPPEAFAVAVIFAANCSFASPVGYQTNLLVMAPGGYRFTDFVRVGTPLLIVCWLAFSFFAPIWWEL